MWMNASNNLFAFVRSQSHWMTTYVEQDVQILTEDLGVLVVKASVCIMEQYVEVRLSAGTWTVCLIFFIFYGSFSQTKPGQQEDSICSYNLNVRN